METKKNVIGSLESHPAEPPNNVSQFNWPLTLLIRKSLASPSPPAVPASEKLQPATPVKPLTVNAVLRRKLSAVLGVTLCTVRVQRPVEVHVVDDLAHRRRGRLGHREQVD